MDVIILFWYISCKGDECHSAAFSISKEATAIVSCESGDGQNFGTYSLNARSETNDGGLFQFNDKTYMNLTGRTNAELDTPQTQYDTFRKLWNNGKGWRHWKASQHCWSQWISINNNTAEWKNTDASLD